jgi:hypothetical protein
MTLRVDRHRQAFYRRPRPARRHGGRDGEGREEGRQESSGEGRIEGREGPGAQARPRPHPGELESAPKTCKAFVKALPFKSSFVHVRWSGEGVWVPLGDRDFGVGYENHTSFPAPGQMLLYPTGISETELIMAYGGVRFACKMGQLAGNHFLTVIEGQENLAALGKACLWQGAQELTIDWA